MKKQGQVFTFDMLLALIMAMLIVSSSGVVLSITRERTSSYVSRYSLNSIASDSADVLVKSPGKPVDWISNLDNLKTPGLASFNTDSNRAIPNLILIEKITWLRELTRTKNWDVSTKKTQAIMSLFGGTEKFEIKVAHKKLLAREPLADLDLDIENTLFGVEVEIEAENEDDVIETDVELEWDGESESESENAPPFTMVVTGGGLTIEVIVEEGVIEVKYKTVFWDIWPGWDEESSSGVENSLEVASVNRSGYITSLIKTRLATDPLVKMENNSSPEDYQENWQIYEGELELYDWYLYIRTSKERENQVKFVKIRVNGRGVDYKFRPKDDGWYEIYPSTHGGMEDDLKDIVEGTNNLEISVKPEGGGEKAKKDWAELYVIAAPACMIPEKVVLLREVPIHLQVKVWR